MQRGSLLAQQACPALLCCLLLRPWQTACSRNLRAGAAAAAVAGVVAAGQPGQRQSDCAATWGLPCCQLCPAGRPAGAAPAASLPPAPSCHPHWPRLPDAAQHTAQSPGIAGRSSCSARPLPPALRGALRAAHRLRSARKTKFGSFEVVRSSASRLRDEDSLAHSLQLTKLAKWKLPALPTCMPWRTAVVPLPV